ncbi:endonuclease-reverse transcriptase [Elysia marginata]|uniref:Endonuclease-reverse transcriptase n=1 Tax=Elysia marginata TaxID=1093978 RepID=A0AAV4JK15_9GAST|nr:endonuclease-reverse transcriptase [Elysia marginata]
MLMKRAVEVQRDVCLCFIDYSKAFDKVKHSELFGILDQLNIDGKDLRILRNLYCEQVAGIRIDWEYTDFTEIKRDVRQGCALSPDLLNLYSEVILRNITDVEGVKVGGRNITNLRYADDTVLIANSQENFQALLSVVTYESKSIWLQLNARKTECMVISKKQVKPHCVIQCKNRKIKQVEKLKYLGFTISSNAKFDQEIKKRIAMSKEVFTKMGTIFKNRNIQFVTKVKVLKAYVWSVLVYGSECWGGLDSSVGSGFAPWPRGRGFEPQPSTVRAPTGWVGVSIM